MSCDFFSLYIIFDARDKSWIYSIEYHWIYSIESHWISAYLLCCVCMSALSFHSYNMHNTPAHSQNSCILWILHTDFEQLFDLLGFCFLLRLHGIVHLILGFDSQAKCSWLYMLFTLAAHIHYHFSHLPFHLIWLPYPFFIILSLCSTFYLISVLIYHKTQIEQTKLFFFFF